MEAKVTKVRMLYAPFCYEGKLKVRPTQRLRDATKRNGFILSEELNMEGFTMFTIYHRSEQGGGFKLRLRVARLGDLFLHEEIVPTEFERLVNTLRNDRALQHPIIVDDGSNVILDGMHRVAALQKLGFLYIVACGVNYYNPLIEVKSWFRVFTGPPWDEKVLDRVGQLTDCTIEELSTSQFQEKMKTGHAVTGFILPMRETIPTVAIDRSSPDAKQIYDKLIEIERVVLRSGFNIEYKSEPIAREAVETGRASFALATKRLLKEEVIRVATRGEVFPPKTTRHVIPVRPLFINVPLRLLSTEGPGKDEEERNKILDAFLRQRRLVKVRGHITLDRFYEEDYLYLFT